MIILGRYIDIELCLVGCRLLLLLGVVCFCCYCFLSFVPTFPKCISCAPTHTRTCWYRRRHEMTWHCFVMRLYEFSMFFQCLLRCRLLMFLAFAWSHLYWLFWRTVSKFCFEKSKMKIGECIQGGVDIGVVTKWHHIASWCDDMSSRCSFNVY